ncbi:MAG: hypothetical protein ACLFTT_07810 [Candidatus Hydrogenedentota bacterium]
MTLLSSTLIGLAAVFAEADIAPAPAPWLEWYAANMPSSAAAPGPVPWLDWFAERVSFATAEAVASSVAAAETAPNRAANSPTEFARMRREMQSLRNEVRQLQATLDQFMHEVARPLNEENRHLREELQRVYMLHGEQGGGLFPQVPRPNDDLVQDIVDTAVARLMAEQASGRRGADSAMGPPPAQDVSVPDAGGRQAQPTGEADYEVISEWGRDPASPSVVAGEAPSLKGMVLVVPPGMGRDELVQLGRELRAQYDDYANINIEVFDQHLAAQSFAETSVSIGPEHRVLSVSRHLASGRDTIVYITDGEGTKIEVDE